MKAFIVNILSIFLLIASINLIGQNNSNQYVTGEILIQCKTSNGIDKLISAYHSFGLVKKQLVSKRFNIYLLGYNTARTSNDEIIQSLNNDAAVVHAQNNHFISVREQTELLPNDPSFNIQWSLHNTGQSGGTPGADIDAASAWDITTGGVTAEGDTIVVAIIDGGSDINHIDLDHWTNHVEIPNNNIDDDNNGYVDDIHGWNAYNHNGNIPNYQHGAHVAGIAGAKGNNDIGVSGVNWNVKILAVAGSSTTESIVVEALSYVYVVREQYDMTNGQEGAFVVADNCSFGVDKGQPENFPIWEAMYDSLGQLGILSVGATANKNWDIDSVGDVPTAFSTPYMISVTNTNNDDEKYSFAGYGETTIDLGAPGTSIYSTLVGNTYGYKSGTSMAAPHVTGSIALLMAAADSAFISTYKNNPQESILQIKDYLLNGVDTLSDLIGKTVTGGRLNVFNSMNLLLNAPSLSLDKDSIFEDVLINTQSFSSLTLSNTGGDTIYYSISVDGDPDWLELSQYEGSLPSLEWNEISLSFYADGLDTGLYYTTLEISASNISTRYLPVTMHVYNNVGIQNQRINDPVVSIFPNPFSSLVTFNLKGRTGSQYRIEIFNESGKQVLAKTMTLKDTNQSFDWHSEYPGIYYYRILSNGVNITSGKLVHL
jgi:hypothetical protein